jgi:hypothetical protein
MPATDIDTALEGVLEAAQIDPDALEAEAAALNAAAVAAISTPPQLFLEAAQKRALAHAERRRRGAAEGVRVTSMAVGIGEEMYAATEEPERAAEARAFGGGQALQRAQADYWKALDERAAEGELRRLKAAIRDAAEVSDDLDAQFEEAKAARAKAWDDLETARNVRRKARAQLEAAEAACAVPEVSDLPEDAVSAALLWCWPWRLFHAGRSEPALSPVEDRVVRGYAALCADLAGAIPKGAEARVVAEARADFSRQLHGVTLPLPDGRTLNVGQALGLPAGRAGR